MNVRQSILVASVLVATAAHADQVVLEVSVRQLTHVKKDAYAFPGVGVFQIVRGTQPFQGASCPDLSNKDGRLTCSIGCDKADATVKPLRVVPPSRAVRGFIPPPLVDIELKGCTLVPPALPPFLYRDAKLVVENALQKAPELARTVAAMQDGKGFNFVPVGEALPVLVGVASSDKGRQALYDLNAAAGAFAVSSTETDPNFAQTLSDYQVGITNILLREAVKSKAGSLPVSLKISFDKADYYNNLVAVEDALDRKVGRTPQQNIFLNDIQKLKGKSIDPLRNANLYKHVPGVVQAGM